MGYKLRIDKATQEIILTDSTGEELLNITSLGLECSYCNNANLCGSMGNYTQHCGSFEEDANLRETMATRKG